MYRDVYLKSIICSRLMIPLIQLFFLNILLQTIPNCCLHTRQKENMDAFLVSHLLGLACVPTCCPFNDQYLCTPARCGRKFMLPRARQVLRQIEKATTDRRARHSTIHDRNSRTNRTGGRRTRTTHSAVLYVYCTVRGNQKGHHFPTPITAQQQNQTIWIETGTGTNYKRSLFTTMTTPEKVIDIESLATNWSPEERRLQRIVQRNFKVRSTRDGSVPMVGGDWVLSADGSNATTFYPIGRNKNYSYRVLRACRAVRGGRWLQDTNSKQKSD